MEKTKDKIQINRRALLAILTTCVTGWTFAFLATNIFRDYALGLFIWLPFVMGAMSTIIYGYNNNTDKGRLFMMSFMSLLIFCFGLLFFAWEGLICLLMALPIGIFFNWLGHWIGYKFLKSKVGNTSTTIILLILSVPLLMAFENTRHEHEQLRSVITSIEIDATPEQVWNKVIAFPQLQNPTEFIFKTGIAYPINATINGRGVGAIRHCNFLIGRFVEPISTWDEPKLLKFSVTEQPEPMKELSFYNIH